MEIMKVIFPASTRNLPSLEQTKLESTVTKKNHPETRDRKFDLFFRT